MSEAHRAKRASPPHALNLNVRGLRVSATLAINERAKAMLESGQPVFKLGLGQSPFPVPEVVVKRLQEHAHEKSYLPVRGLRALRHAVAGYHRLRHGVECSLHDVLIGPGSKESLGAPSTGCPPRGRTI